MATGSTIQERGEIFRAAWRSINHQFGSKPDFKELESEQAIWRTLLPPGRAKAEDIKVKSQLSDIARLDGQSFGKLSLGHAIRLHVVRELTCPECSLKDFMERIKNASEPPFQSYSGNTSNLPNSLNPLTAEGFKREWDIRLRYACAAFVNAEIRSGRSLPPIGVTDLFEKDFCGLDAIFDFEDFLLGREPRIQPFLADHSMFATTGIEREKLVEQVTERVFEPCDAPLVCNIFTPGMWHGLQAFGGFLAGHISSALVREGDDRLALYLPAGRFWHAEPMVETQNASGYHVFLGRLRHFYCDDMAGIAQALPVGPAEDIHEVLHQIRQSMIKRPRVLILNGVYTKAASDSVAGIESFVASDAALDTLSMMLDPALCSFETDKDFDSYSRNRIIVLSNEDLSLQSVWKPPHPKTTVCPYPLPEPHQDDVEDVLRSQKLPLVDAVIARRAENKNLTRTWQDAEYHILSALLCLNNEFDDCNIDTVFARLASRGHEISKDTGFQRPLFYELVQAIPAERRLLVKLLYLIAAAPDGLRFSTLRRLVTTALATRSGHQLVDPSEIHQYASKCSIQGDNDAITRRALDDLLEVFQSILRLDHQDYYSGLDTLSYSLEMGSSRKVSKDSQWESSDHASIMFVSPVLREVARDVLVGTSSQEAFHFCHRILAEDALRQQVVALRHAATHETQSIYHWRRQVAAIYHGLCSLPIAADSGKRTAYFSESSNQDLTFASTPQKPRSFWRWLYLFAYRRMIEQPPIYAMSRVYGQDRLKRDILVAFNKPWSLWPRSLPDRQQMDGVDDLFLGDCYQTEEDTDRAQRREVGIAYQLSLFQSNHILGDITAMKGNLIKLRDFLPNEVGINLAISVLKRRLDHHNLTLNPVRELELSVGSISHCFEAALSTEGILAIEEIVEKSTSAYLGCMLHSDSADELGHSFGISADSVLCHFAEELQSASGISSVADLLFRVAEYHAIQADCSGHELGAGEESVQVVYAALLSNLDIRSHRFRLLSDRSISSPQSRVIAFCQSHALFVLAEKLRLRAFNMEPLSGQFLASGHAIRTLMRIGLKLETFRRRLLSSQGVLLVGLGPFGERFRHDSDTMTRHLFRYPRERATQLVTEASMMRLLGGAARYDAVLDTGRELLSRAEAITNATSTLSRHRIRLALERGKIHRAKFDHVLSQMDEVGERSAQEASSHLKEASFYLNLVEWDLCLLKSLSDSRDDCPIWVDVSNKQGRKLKDRRIALEKAKSKSPNEAHQNRVDQ